MSLEFLLKAKEIAVATVFSAAFAISGCSVSNKYEGLPPETLYRVAGEDLQMSNPHRFFKNDLEKVLNAPNEEGDIALIILPRSDHNGAFQSYYAKKTFSEIVKRYRTFAYEVDSDTQIVESARRVSKYGKISLLVICGHGEKQSIELDKQPNLFQLQINTQNPENFSATKDYLNALLVRDRVCFDLGDVRRGKMDGLVFHLAENALVFLSSCSVGEGGYGGDNIANALADKLRPKKCRVVASQSSFKSGDVQFMYENGVISDVIIRDYANTLRIGGVVSK